jgi:hypothetical protein
MDSYYGLFALVCGVAATQGRPLPPCAVGASFDIFFLAACVYTLMGERKTLKRLSADSANLSSTGID